MRTGAVANLDTLAILDGIYAAVRDKPFGER
jgi:hypothetical protein